VSEFRSLVNDFKEINLTQNQEVHVEDGRKALAREVLIKQGKINP